MRVCQALVLPPYQGRGLGRELLQQVYRLAADREFVVEVTVEDPAPAFQCLRDAVDVEWMMRLQATSKQGTNSSKLTPAQLEFVKQCADYRRLCRLDSIPAICGTKRPCDDSILVNCPAPLSGPKHKGGKFSTEMKSFRLRVKKHLLVLHGDLRGLGRTDMQNELAVLYSEME
ncbi:HAT1, partial [Symbiodinium microadriaticum]